MVKFVACYSYPIASRLWLLSPGKNGVTEVSVLAVFGTGPQTDSPNFEEKKTGCSGRNHKKGCTNLKKDALFRNVLKKFADFSLQR